MKNLVSYYLLAILTVISTNSLCFAEKDVQLNHNDLNLFSNSPSLLNPQSPFDSNYDFSTDNIYLFPNKENDLKVEFYSNHDTKIKNWVANDLEEEFLEDEEVLEITEKHIQSTNTYLDFNKKKLAKIVRVDYPLFCHKETSQCLTYVLYPDKQGNYQQMLSLFVKEIKLATKETNGFIDLIINPDDYLGGRYEFNGTEYHYIGK